MGKYITIGIVVALLVVAARFNLHNLYLRHTESSWVLSSWSEKGVENIFTEYAELPIYDRALIENRCTPVYEKKKEYAANRQELPFDEEKECQTLIVSGWFPNWSLSGYRRWLRER